MAHAEDNRGYKEYKEFDSIFIDEVKRKRSWKRQLLFLMGLYLMGLYVDYNAVYCFVKSRE
ncbi:TPA: hypothetical protein ACGX4N_000253 [Bacillus cereus]|uniref:hypothetical protein n=1 Tax=Bacillus cereus TaxID=1396 RepID=UPI001FF5B444|nr:hypothetical protein [Bacillus cereus]MDA2447781.1 hypothetical protein [Bacillus cereus]MDA2453857.1 hypothetical protein [Bacillus cereus]UOX98659.1 hypothetical protein MWG54_25420 [Bacillus cereus]